ncbi:MAG: hypothetical protein IT242_10405 [Bacteroidia bacterium]|nr:hypothetical protein [Bacteroidia bacterium]
MRYHRFFLPLLAVVILTVSCKKPDEYPIIPAIDFKNIYSVRDNQGYDENVYVTIGFTDGDGDIGYHTVESGLNDPIFDDPASPYYNDYIVTTYKLNNGTWSVLDTFLRARLPFLTPDGPNKSLKGEIVREFPVPLALVNDTLRYEIFLYDRALHKSNVVTTSGIVLTTR